MRVQSRRRFFIVNLLVIALVQTAIERVIVVAADETTPAPRAAPEATTPPPPGASGAPEPAKAGEPAPAADSKPASAAAAAEGPAKGATPEPSGAAPAQDSGAEGKREGRAEGAPAGPQTSSSPDTKGSGASSTEKPASSAAPAKPEQPKKSPQRASTRPPTKAAKPASNLGTVTSTGSGGPSHYISKHDAYSAIAEKHGALGQAPETRRADKRAGSSSPFSPYGIQKASGGIGDLLNPFKTVTDTGLARTLGASMRSIMKGKYSVPAYVASALLGAVALLAFYESPISPLPVPPLPEPPVGRFPPEMPIISPNARVPFRTNQALYGNQRSANAYYPQAQPQPGQQQVLFPSSAGGAQQRQMMPSVAAPVQQLAANLLSVGKLQAQRKSSLDYESPLTRSAQTAAGQPATTAGQQPANKPNPFLAFFGLGGSGASGSAPAQPAQGSATLLDSVAALGDHSARPESSSGPGMSNSHLVNKFKSYFNRAGAGAPASSAPPASGPNPYQQYQRMSFVQALMKDTAFLPGFLTSPRKPAAASGGAQQAPSGGPSKLLAATSGGSPAVAASRMQPEAGLAAASNLAAAAGKQRTGSALASLGLSRAADKIAHALLETFTSGIAQRSLTGAGKSAGALDSGALASATSSLISNIMSTYSVPVGQQLAGSSQEPQLAASPANGELAGTQQSGIKQQAHAMQDQPVAGSDAANAGAQMRSSSDVQQVSSGALEQQPQQQQQQQQQPSSYSNVAGGSAAKPLAGNALDQQQSLTRKTRSIGFEYPSNLELAGNQEPAGTNYNNREQQLSKAAQINNVIDFVSDSYTNNRLLFNFVMNQVGLSHAVPYVEQILAPTATGNNN